MIDHYRVSTLRVRYQARPWWWAIAARPKVAANRGQYASGCSTGTSVAASQRSATRPSTGSRHGSRRFRSPIVRNRRYHLRMGPLTVNGYRIEPLSMRTWDAFADLAERHSGVWGVAGARTSTSTRIPRRSAGRSAIASSSGVSSRPAVRTPRWYSTVTPRLRGPSSGRSQSYRTSTTARSGSRASPGCRTTGSRYPHDLPEGKKTSASFLYNATRTMYERLGFTYERSKGKGNCVMSAVVPAATS